MQGTINWGHNAKLSTTDPASVYTTSLASNSLSAQTRTANIDVPSTTVSRSSRTMEAPTAYLHHWTRYTNHQKTPFFLPSVHFLASFVQEHTSGKHSQDSSIPKTVILSSEHMGNSGSFAATDGPHYNWTLTDLSLSQWVSKLAGVQI